MIGRPHLVGRDAIVADLAARGAAVSSAGASVISIVGAAGIGKSRLLRVVADAHRIAHVDGQVLWAHGMEWESRHPGALLSQLLQDDSASISQLLHEITSAVPVLIVVDDADAADAESMQQLLGLVAHHRRLPVLILIAMRDPGAAIDLEYTDTVALEGITTDAVIEIAADRGIVLHPALAVRLTAHTAGNPRAVLAMLAAMPAGSWDRPDIELFAPQYVIDDLRDRLGRCSSDGRALVEALAIVAADDPVGIESLSTATELAGIEDPLVALDDAIDAGLVMVSGGMRPAEVVPRLRSAMHRSAVNAVMGLQATAAAHRRAAELVADPARRLQHLVAATPTDDPELADRLDALARERGVDGEWSEAAQLFRQAGRLTSNALSRDERLTRAVDALLAAGDCLAATALVPAVESLRETSLRNATLAYLAILRGRSTEADIRLGRAWDICNAEREPETAAVIAQRRVLHSLVCCQGAELVRWADTAIELSAARSPSRTEASVIKGLGLAWSGEGAAARVLYAELTASIRHGAQAQRVTMGRGWLEFGHDEIDSARSSLETAVSMAQLGGSTRITQWALGWLARVQFVTGEWDLALSSVRRGRELARGSGIALVTPLMEWTAAQIYSLRGDWQRAQQSVTDSVVGDGSYEIMQAPAMLARAARAEAMADYAKVRESLTPLIALGKQAPGLTEPGFWPWVDVLANAMVLEGQLSAADALLAPHEERARARGHRSASARLGYARGRMLGAAGDLPAARRTFDEALANLDGLPLRYDRARVNFAYGQTLRRAGKRRAADEVISRARELYLSLGAEAYVARCDRELRAGGLNAPRGHSNDVELTAQEEAVSSLVARGLTNREVAAELYISPKTVQYHLTRVFGKLGVRSRSELAALLR